MTGEQRILAALEMSVFARELARAGIRHDHPDWTEAQVERERLRLVFLPNPLPSGL
jgi:Rv0078B-related antitoxin